MFVEALPFDAPLKDYDSQADRLLAGWRSGDADAVRVFRQKHPTFLDTAIPWLPRNMTDADVRATVIDRDDARMAVARWYDFRDWAALEVFVSAVGDNPAIARFERAVDAVVNGDADRLREMLRQDPDLIAARSTRVTHFDPPVHRATLLHYLAANGVEGHRQRSPANAPVIASMLLDAGADPNALCSLYGGECSTMSLLVSSAHPKSAGVELPLLNLLVERGASIEPEGHGNWTSPIETALVFNHVSAAQALVDRGARILSAAAAAGLGRLDDLRRLVPGAPILDRHRALALAAQCGQVGAVRLLLDAGEDPNRFNPPGTHAHTPPLHQAVAAGHLDVVKLLVERGANLDIRDSIHRGTPLGWAIYCEQPAIAAYLRSLGAEQ